MLGNPKWFKRRKYLGWGLTPATWQGWVYLIAVIGGLFFANALMISLAFPKAYKLIILVLLLMIVILDMVVMTTQLTKDERELQHEALAERNAAWSMVSILAIGLVFQIITSILNNQLLLDPFMTAAIVVGVLAKGFTNWYLVDK